MTIQTSATTCLAALLLLPGVARAQHPDMPAGMTHEEHLRQMEKDATLKARGGLAMGFDQDATAHHFLMTRDGGSIAVDVRNPEDRTNLAAIRSHLQEIAVAFRQGDFGKPLATHGEYPDGVDAMRRLHADITYSYADTPLGGIVRIVATSPEARDAVRRFLAYQVKEHATGDPQP